MSEIGIELKERDNKLHVCPRLAWSSRKGTISYMCVQDWHGLKEGTGAQGKGHISYMCVPDWHGLKEGTGAQGKGQ